MPERNDATQKDVTYQCVGPRIKQIRDSRALPLMGEPSSPRHIRGKPGQHAQLCQWKIGKQLNAGNRHSDCLCDAAGCLAALTCSD